MAVAEREGWDVIDVIRIPGFSRRYFTLRELVDAANEAGEPGPGQLEKHIDAADFDVMAVRSTNRFGREQSINAEVIGKVIRVVGAQIYSQMDGMIHRENFRAMAAITGYRDAGQVDELVRGRATGIIGNAKKGLPPSARVPISHRLIRDPQTGKANHLELREELLPMWRDLATLVLTGISFNRLEYEMFERWGYGKQSQPYAPNTFVRLLLNPVAWGHSVIRWRRQTAQISPRGTWCLDNSELPPVGVDMFYDTHAPIYAGALAERIKAELRRRATVYNRHSQQQTNRFAGIAYCDECHWAMVYNVHHRPNKTHVYLRCNQRYNKYRHIWKCQQSLLLLESDVWRYLNDFLQDCLDKGEIAFEQQPAQDSALRELGSLRSALQKLEHRRNRLIDELGDSDDDSVRMAYRQRIQTATADIERARAHVEALELQVTRQQKQTLDQQAGLDFIRVVTLPGLWASDSLTVNQWLKRTLGTYRLRVRDGEILGWFNLEDLKP